MDHKGMKKLSMWMPMEIHRQLKEVAAKYGISITQLVLKLIVNFLHQESSK